MKNDIITLDITDLTPEGFGVGRHDGKVVFVADTAVGDKCEVKIVKELKSHSFAKLLNVIEPSPDRIEPDCEVCRQCGGCSFRHISYDAELRIKKNIVEQAFNRIGGIDIKVNDTVSDNPDGYRNKVQYPFAPDGKNVVFGYYARRSHRIVKHSECKLQDAIFTEIADFCAKTAEGLGVTAYDEVKGKGVLRHAVMRKNRKGEIILCLVVAEKDKNLKSLAESIYNRFDNVIGVHINLNKRRDNVIFGEETYKLVGNDTLRDTLCGREFELSPRAFYQVNAVMAEKLYSYAGSLIPKKETGNIILDLYCGAGTIGLCVAREQDKLCGVEIIEPAVENAKINARLNGRNENNTLFVCGDASVGVGECKKKFGNPDTIIVDPPRKGLDKAVIETVVNASPENIVYISCDVATLARDCAIFAQYGYTTNEATPFDLFPRTGHVETVVCLSRKTTHEMKLYASPFEKIKSGTKNIELRLFDEKRQTIKIGDNIIFTNTVNGEKMCATVKKLHQFSSFEELYKTLPLLQCGYTADDIDTAHPADMEQYYSAEEQKKYGVVGIELFPPKQITDETAVCLSKQ